MLVGSAVNAYIEGIDKLNIGDWLVLAGLLFLTDCGDLTVEAFTYNGIRYEPERTMQ